MAQVLHLSPLVYQDLSVGSVDLESTGTYQVSIEPCYDLPCPLPSSARGLISGWAYVRCQLSKAGLQGQVHRDICVASYA